MSPKTLGSLLLAGLVGLAQARAGTPPPSLELLEFLAEFGDVEASTFDLIEYHAQQDLKSEPASLEDQGHSEPGEQSK